MAARVVATSAASWLPDPACVSPYGGAVTNYQLLSQGNHTRHTAPAWKLPTGAIDWKEILHGLTTVEAIHLITPDQV